jgi:hypothetical protein
MGNSVTNQEKEEFSQSKESSIKPRPRSNPGRHLVK